MQHKKHCSLIILRQTNNEETQKQNEMMSWSSSKRERHALTGRESERDSQFIQRLGSHLTVLKSKPPHLKKKKKNRKKERKKSKAEDNLTKS